MKKNLLLIISLIFLLGISSAYAEEAASYDFENYRETAGALFAANANDGHDKKLKMESGNTRGVSFKPTVSSGKYLISFEVLFEDYDQVLRLHMTSPTTGSDSHSIIYFSGSVGKDPGSICSSDSSKGAWSFPKLMGYELNRWYQIDLLLDLDDLKITYYIDGENYGQRTLGLVDFSYLMFRSENGKSGAVLYLDNISYKYLSPGSFDTEYKGTAANADSDTVTLIFSDLVNRDTLDGIKVYNMGNNPVSYSQREVSYTVTNVEAKKVTLKLSEKFGRGNIYKIYAPGVKTMFGDGYTNDSAYFSAGGVVGLVKDINADFSTIADVAVMKPVLPASDTEWDRNAKSVFPVYVNDLDENGSDIAVVHFTPGKGKSSNPTNLETLSRTFDNAYTGSVGMEYKIKAKNGNQIFRINDSKGAALDIITIKKDGIYTADKKIADYAENSWFTLRVNADFETKTAQILMNGDVIEENADISAVEDLKSVEFRQENSESYENTEFTKDMYADSWVAYFSLLTMQECTSVTVVSFEDKDGNLYYPDEKIPSDVVKMHIAFSDKMNETSFKNGVSLTFGSENETFSGSYDSENNEYVVELPQYLAGGEEYRLRVSDNVKNASNKGINALDGRFKTADGLVRAENFTFEKTEGGVSLEADIIHTDKSCPRVFLIYAAYNDDMVIDFKYKAIEPGANERNISECASYSYPAEADTVSAFLWDGFDTMIPMAKMQTAN